MRKFAKNWLSMLKNAKVWNVPKGAQRCPKVPKNTQKYQSVQKVPKSMQKYAKVWIVPRKYLKLHKSTQEVSCKSALIMTYYN